MTTTLCYDESLAERHEVFYPITNMIDTEPLYKNFTTIHNLLQKQDETKQSQTVCIHNILRFIFEYKRILHSPRQFFYFSSLFHMILIE